MLSRFYILQHGLAVSPEQDEIRPLSDQGIKDIKRLAEYLAVRSETVQHIFHSAKLRAEQTAHLMAEGLASHTSENTLPVMHSGLSPNDDPFVFLKHCEVLQGSALIVSHMPFVSRLCSILVSNQDKVQFAYEPGTLVVLESVNDEWRLITMTGPSWL